MRTRLVAASALALVVGFRAHAAGFQLQEQTASGLGLAYSGMPAAAQDAGSVYWNPAALPLVAKPQVVVAAHYVDTSFDFVSAGGPPNGSTFDAFGDGGDGGDASLIPAIYGAMEINPQISVGLGINAPFGLRTDWDFPWAGMFYTLESEVETLNINPVVGFRLGERVMLGAGVSYSRLEATLTNAVTPLVPTAVARLEGDDWAFGWNVGALVDFGQGTRVGLTYRANVDHTISGDLTFNDPSLAPLAADVRAELELPDTAAIGLSHQITEALRVLADYTWTGWDSVQSLIVTATTGPQAGQPVSSIVLNFDNSWRAGLGLEYQVDPRWLLRIGVAYDNTPVQDAFRTPRLPDADRRWGAIGARFQPNDNWSFDVGYAHLWISEVPSNLAPPGPVPGALRGHYDSSSDIVAVQASFQF